MNLRDFRKAGHWPTLLCAFLYFDVSFMIWVLIGALGVSIGTQLKLDPERDAFWKGLLIAVPALGGSLMRVVLGVMTDRIGPRRTGLIGVGLTAIPLLLGWMWAESFSDLILVGLMLGVAGASFAAALPLAGRWYPPKYQGLAMGIAGAGNSGTALATFFGPMLAAAFGPGGWHYVFALSLAPLAITFILYFLLAKDSPTQPAPQPLAAYGKVLAYADTWWFCLFYAVTFGGFVGLATFLNTFFKDQFFRTDKVTGALYASYFTTACVIAGSFLRPVGGYLADRFGGVHMLLGLYLTAAVLLLGLGGLLLGGLAAVTALVPAAVLLFLIMGLLGMGNGSVFQLVPQRFRQEIGVMTGVVGAAGGVGGFLLPILISGLKGAVVALFGAEVGQAYGFAPGLAVFGLVSGVCLVLLARLRPRWESTFLADLRTPDTAAAVEPALEPSVAGAN
jgi:NNP family nitrate/nitrite transporter-like MFS transporter